jgi:hypothetical protein
LTELTTGVRKKTDALNAVGDIIEDVFRPVVEIQAPSSWDQSLADLDRTPDLRPDSIRAYRTAVKALRMVFPELAGPRDVTPALAHRFKRQFLAGTYTRGKASDAARYSRSPTSCTTYLRCLRSLWRKHFKPLGHVTDNPWLDVPYPNTPRGKRVRVPAEETVAEFFVWLAKKHPGWDLPRVFVEVKMLAGCRTIDLCKVRTADLGHETLTLTAEATKTREARTVPLTPELDIELRRLAGPVWLWERSVEDSKQYRSNPRTRGMTRYNPSTWRWTIQNLFREFNEGRPVKSRLRPHDLRARAVTLVATATQSVDATAHTMGVDPQTARVYVDAGKAFDRHEVLKRLAGSLVPAKTTTVLAEK